MISYCSRCKKEKNDLDRYLSCSRCLGEANMCWICFNELFGGEYLPQILCDRCNRDYLINKILNEK